MRRCWRHRDAETRVVYPKIKEDHRHAYKGNYVATTKYTFITFLPKALYEQFRRIANVYFTVVAALSCTAFSPVHPVTTFSPLLLVLGVSIAKEALEDYKRFKADREVNNRDVEVFNDAKREFVTQKWRSVHVGDVVAVTKDSFFPADLLFLSGENEDGVCFVETISLDGESNLKIKKAVDPTAHLMMEDIGKLTCKIQCEAPNASLYTFTGNIELTPPFVKERKLVPISPASVLLRGCSLRNTPRIIGVVLFAGHESKVMMNATDPPSKRTQIERSMDRMILFMFALLFAMCLWGAIYFATWTREESRKAWYLAPEQPMDEFDPGNPVVVAMSSFITSFILYGYLIPISLYVSMETVKVIQSLVFIAKDRTMYHKESDTPAAARTSNLNEELGMVETILSDKTGTLTRNVMEFFKCSIGGVVYGKGVTEIERANAERMGFFLEVESAKEAEQHKEKFFNFYDPRLLHGQWTREDHPETIRHFFRLLAICHTVIPDGERTVDGIVYEAESPDEQALVVAAKKFGFFFYHRGPTSVKVRETVGRTVTDNEYEILNILEFSSTRKRMSVIFRGSDGRLFLYCKGADTVIYERLDPNHVGNKVMKDITRTHMEDFGGAGLRTLCLSYAEIDPQFYDVWQERYFQAKTALNDREEKVAEAAEMIERNLRLLGCTAIEDKLQDGVPECISKLADAGIRIWVLTGDKQETAINIGFACSLLHDDMVQYIVTTNLPEVVRLEEAGKKTDAAVLARSKVQRQLEDALAHIKAGDDSTMDTALIIDGKALVHALGKPIRRTFLRVGVRCKSVICCRVSPKQKAQVTALIKKKGAVTLAIGDGANDVGMIQEAHIGVGISGQEGMQAVMSSDFAIAQFRFLRPLLLVHGRWCYKRIARMVLFFVYKNVLFGMTIFLYNAICVFSGQIIYDDFYMSLYNVIFTSLAPLVVGLLDQDVNRKISEKYPGLYRAGQRNQYFNAWMKMTWFLSGFVHAALTTSIVFVATKLYADRASGQTYGHWQTGTVLFSCVVVTVHVQLASILEHWTIFHHLAIWGSIAVWFVYLIVYGSMPIQWSTNMHRLFVDVVALSPQFWLIVCLTPIVCVLPDFFVRCAHRHLIPDDHQLVQEIQKKIARSGASSKTRRRKKHKTVSVEDLPHLGSGRRVSINRGYVPDNVPGSVSYFAPKSTTGQLDSESRGVSRHPVVAKLDRELSNNPFRHRARVGCRTSSEDSGRLPEATPLSTGDVFPGNVASIQEEVEESVSSMECRSVDSQSVKI